MSACAVCLTDFSPDCPACVHPSHYAAPQPRGVSRPHQLQWGDAYESFLRCTKCGTGFGRDARLLDTLSECSGAVVS
jgi:hypothetical protein